MRSLLLLAVTLGACASTPEPTWDPATPIPPDSVYVLDTPLTDQRGETVTLAVHRGHPVLISMFYASCPTACPMLIEEVKGVESALSRAALDDLRVLFVSLDPERDTPAAMAEVTERHGLDAKRWTLARTEPDRVREIAAVLGVQYRARADGEMNHTSIVTILDRDGRPLLTQEGLGRDREPVLDALAGLRP